MRSHTVLSTFLLMSLLVGAAFAQEGPLTLHPSVIWERRLVDTPEGSVEISTIRVPSGKLAFRLAVPQNVESGGSSLSRFWSDEGAIAAFTGGFLDTYSPATPSGFVRQGDKKYSDIRPRDPVMRAVVCYSVQGQVRIVDVEQFSEQRHKGDCIQTGPLLVSDGQDETDFDLLDKRLNFVFARKPFDRAFILLNAQEEIIIGVSKRISLFALRDVLRKPTTEGGYGAREAVALSGTRTAGLIVADQNGKERTAGNVGTLLPNAIIIAER